MDIEKIFGSATTTTHEVVLVPYGDDGWFGVRDGDAALELGLRFQFVEDDLSGDTVVMWVGFERDTMAAALDGTIYGGAADHGVVRLVLGLLTQTLSVNLTRDGEEAVVSKIVSTWAGRLMPKGMRESGTVRIKYELRTLLGIEVLAAAQAEAKEQERLKAAAVAAEEAKTRAIIYIPFMLNPWMSLLWARKDGRDLDALDVLVNTRDDLQGAIEKLTALRENGWEIIGDDDPEHGSYHWQAMHQFDTAEDAVAARAALGLDAEWMAFGTRSDMETVE